MDKERLYDAFGELLYAVALADGMIQPEEINKIEQVLANHSWGREIEWSFNYEKNKNNDPKQVYEKALDTLKQHGPDPEYTFLIEILEEVARASDGIDESEDKVISDMQSSLKMHFIQQVEDMKL
ncbi:TerB family tellurite resistance protein [Limibacter armeniacum]|uniref:tellurite resistance TerB family protein n=1 Tax=Limibacter armeniacum TaxID=466084 RepID=UPI002FE50875